MDPLNFKIAGDDISGTETFYNVVREHSKGPLSDIDYHLHPREYTFHSGNPETIAMDILHSTADSDAVILSIYDYKNSSKLFETAFEIKKRFPVLPVFLNIEKGFTQENRDRMVAVARESHGHPTRQRTELIDRVLYPHYSPDQVHRAIRYTLFRPLKKIAGLGMGIFGRQITQHLADSDAVERIDAYSMTMHRKGKYDSIRGSLDISGSRKLRGIRKVNLVESLEEAVDGAEVVYICTGKYEPVTKKLTSKITHRLQLLSTDGPRVMEYLKLLRDIDYKGLIVIFSNPVGANNLISNRLGFENGQATSSIHIDEDRFQGLIKDPFTFFEYNCIAGDHGEPVIAEFARTANHRGNVDEAVRQERLEFVRQILLDALSQSRKMSFEAVLRSRELANLYYKAGEAAVDFFIDLAALTRNPPVSAYCDITIGDYSGSLAVPSEFSFFPHIRTSPNTEIIEKIDESSMKELERLLREQNQAVDDFLQRKQKPPHKNLMDRIKLFCERFPIFRKTVESC